MSIETICKNCGAEYDMRHGYCPSCTIGINIRSSRPPYETWADLGYFPFEMHGERFAVTKIPCPLNYHQQWRVSHVETGVGIPGTMSATKEQARDAGKTKLAEITSEQFKAAVEKQKTLFR